MSPIRGELFLGEEDNCETKRATWGREKRTLR